MITFSKAFALKFCLARGLFAFCFLIIGWWFCFQRYYPELSPPGVPGWWAQVDSNHRPRAYQARALTTWAMSPFSFGISRSLSPLVEMMGIEPMTPCLQGRCSPSWATPPYIYEVWVSFSVTQNRTTSESTPLKCTLAVFLVFAYLQTFDVTATLLLYITFSIERRWSSRTFRYGYLVTT